MMYYVEEEASGAIVMYSTDKQEAIDYTRGRLGKYLVKNDLDYIVYDSNPGVSYKI